MGVCSALLPFLSSPWTYGAVAGLGITAKLLYMYSSYSFWPNFLQFSNIIRTLGGAASILNLAWRLNIFLFAALYTTFQGTIKAIITNNYNGILDLAMIMVGEIYSKIGLSTTHLVDGLGLLNQWLTQGTSLCSLINGNEFLFSALYEFWVAAAAYIFALRIYDWIWGKGMTREVEWPEAMMVIVAVTLFSVLVGVLNGGLIPDLVSNTKSLLNTTAQIGMDNGFNNTSSQG